MTLREFVDRESRVHPARAAALEQFETAILECDALRVDFGCGYDLLCDRDEPPRYWHAVMVTMEHTRRRNSLNEPTD